MRVSCMTRIIGSVRCRSSGAIITYNVRKDGKTVALEVEVP
jgi:hypothetical protein